MEPEERELIQVLVLSEVCREMGPSLVFQGGTAIRVFLGGTRRSEDLDFYMAARTSHSLDRYVERIAKAITRDLGYTGELTLESFKLNRQDRLNTVWFGFTWGEGRERSRLKVEFLEVSEHFQGISSQATLLATAPLIRRGISSFGIFLDRLNLVVQVETPEGILADKVVAILARPYVKGRDLWDVWFLTEVIGVSPSRDDVELRRKIYDATPWKRSPAVGGRGWPERKELVELLDRDLQRFLDRDETAALRREDYGRILESVENTLGVVGSV